MKTKLLILFTLISLSLVLLSPAQAETVTPNAGDPQLDAVVEKAMRRHNVPGAAVAVVANGELSWVKGYGVTNVADGSPVTTESVFHSASIAKPVTAWGVMTLVEDGLLDLDVPIEQYINTRWQLPASDYNHDEITIRRILSHTAGLSTDGDPGIEPGEYLPTIEEALDGAVLGMKALHVASPPGEDYHYSSVGYTLLEIAIEEVTGESFASYMQRKVLDPLGMVNSGYDWTPKLQSQAVVGHDWYNNPLPEYQYATRAQGGLRTTAADLALFMRASMPGADGEPIGRGVLTPESVAEVLTAVPFAKEAESNHVTGLGFDLIRVDGELLGARKTGDHRGFKPIIVMSLVENAGIAITANSDRAAVGFLIDIVCAWSAGLETNLMETDCRELHMIRNVQIGIGTVLALGVLVYGAWVVRGIHAGHRQIKWELSRGRIIRIALLVVVLVAWWVLWHTDTLFTDILGTLPDTAVTIRLLIPWPTAFIWVSWGVTLWLVAWIAGTFAPKVKQG